MAGTTLNDLQERATILGIPLETLPIRYLGLPLTTKNMTRLNYEPFIDNIRSRFLSWTRKNLSYAGRLQLIKSVIATNMDDPFAKKFSLVSWVYQYPVRNSSYWDILSTTTCGSWMWRKLLKLRDVAAMFFKTDIKYGASTYFWTDFWCDLQPLIKSHCFYEEKFVSKATWNQLRTTSAKVEWYNTAWFPQALPRQDFITWLACRNRLDTCDRMRQWDQTQICPLCGELDETRNHLFFACPFTFTVRTFLMNRFLVGRINPDRSRTLVSLRSNRFSKLDTQVVKMDFHASIYWIWRERNGRRHLQPPNPALYIARTVHREMQNRLQALQLGNVEDGKNERLRRWNNL
ncbi:hypothetical protein N665_0049s0007 [Sinapis alba]|nr:hypothetical protein N665_0049s0007 [Sinapis alba]